MASNEYLYATGNRFSEQLLSTECDSTIAYPDVDVCKALSIVTVQSWHDVWQAFYAHYQSGSGMGWFGYKLTTVAMLAAMNDADLDEIIAEYCALEA